MLNVGGSAPRQGPLVRGLTIAFNMFGQQTTFEPPPPFVIATPKYGINTVPTPTVAITRAWLAHNTYNYRHTRERMV